MNVVDRLGSRAPSPRMTPQYRRLLTARKPGRQATLPHGSDSNLDTILVLASSGQSTVSMEYVAQK